MTPLDPEICEYRKIFALRMLSIQWLLSFRTITINTPVGKGKNGNHGANLSIQCWHSAGEHTEDSSTPHTLTCFVDWMLAACHTYSLWTKCAIRRMMSIFSAATAFPIHGRIHLVVNWICVIKAQPELLTEGKEPQLGWYTCGISHLLKNI